MKIFITNNFLLQSIYHNLPKVSELSSNGLVIAWSMRHGEVLDQYNQIFKHGDTPSSKRKLATTQRWEFLTKKCEEGTTIMPNSKSS